MRFKLNTCKHITWCRKVKKTVIWWLEKTNETNCFKVKIWGGFNLTILKVNKSTMIEWNITIDLNLNIKLPHVKLTNTTTCCFDSTNSSILDLLNTNTHVYDFEIPLKNFRSSAVIDLVAATFDLLVIMVWEWISVLILKGESMVRFRDSESLVIYSCEI